MKGFATRLLMAATLALGLSATAYAHNDKGSESKEHAFQTGQDDGYQAGFRHGREDYRRGIGYNPESQEMKKAGNGRKVKHQGDYKKGFRQGYLSGYREGYEGRTSNARNRYPDNRYPYPDTRYPDSRYPDSRYPDSRYPDSRYPTSRYPDTRYPDNRYPYPNDRDTRYNTAFEMGARQGYEDGSEKGRSDYEKNRNPDLNRHDWYREADHGYKSSYGSKRDYQDGYRQGFRQGYDDNFGNYRRNRNTGSILDQILGRNWP